MKNKAILAGEGERLSNIAMSKAGKHSDSESRKEDCNSVVKCSDIIVMARFKHLYRTVLVMVVGQPVCCH